MMKQSSCLSIDLGVVSTKMAIVGVVFMERISKKVLVVGVTILIKLHLISARNLWERNNEC